MRVSEWDARFVIYSQWMPLLKSLKTREFSSGHASVKARKPRTGTAMGSCWSIT